MKASRTRPDNRRTCETTGKTRFRSQADATMALRGFKAAGDRPGAYVPRRAYECDDCGGWHLTHLEIEAWAEPVTLDTRAGVGLVLAASARLRQETPMTETTTPTFLERIAALLREEVDAYAAANLLDLAWGRSCETCTVAVTARATDGTEIVVRPFAAVAGGALCLDGDCEHDASVAGWWHRCSETYCGDGCDAASNAPTYEIGDLL